jgi:hypothetical protein
VSVKKKFKDEYYDVIKPFVEDNVRYESILILLSYGNSYPDDIAKILSIPEYEVGECAVTLIEGKLLDIFEENFEDQLFTPELMYGFLRIYFKKESKNIVRDRFSRYAINLIDLVINATINKSQYSKARKHYSGCRNCSLLLAQKLREAYRKKTIENVRLASKSYALMLDTDGIISE